MGDTLLWFSAGDEEQPCIGSALRVLSWFSFHLCIVEEKSGLCWSPGFEPGSSCL